MKAVLGTILLLGGPGEYVEGPQVQMLLPNMEVCRQIIDQESIIWIMPDEYGPVVFKVVCGELEQEI